jgi:aspartate aminotransferase
MLKTKISDRLKKIPASPIRKLVPLADQAKKKGLEVLHLNIGNPDIKTPPEMVAVLKNWQINPIGYSQSQGEPVFLDALEFYYKKIGYSFIKKENIQVTSGGSEAISLVFFAIADPGDEILVFEPFYTNYESYAQINHVHLVPVTTYANNGFHLPKPEEIEKKITKKTKAILIANPNNPTGTVYTKCEIEMLVNLVNKHNLFLVSDEVYREFIYDQKKHDSILNYLEKNPQNLILIDSLSKRYSLCGARLGCLVSLNQEILAGVLKIAQGRLSVGLIDQIVGSNLVTVGSQYFRKVNKEYEERRNVLYQGLKKIPGIFLKKPEGAFYAVVKLPVKNAEDFCQWLLTDFSYKNKTVMLAPAAGFYLSKGLGEDEVRIAYVLNKEKIKIAIKILEEALKTYGRKIKKN